MKQAFLSLALTAAWLAASSPLRVRQSGSDGDLLVDTNLFSVQGAVSQQYDDVRFFGNIPYAEPPVGELRFRSPVTKRPENDTIDGTDFGPSCIQYNNGQPTVYSEYLTGFLLRPNQTQSEDCLTLNVWAPRSKSSSSEPLPVMIWVHGGGFTSGGSASPYKYGDNIVHNHQDVIVVAINYRVNIFGFPNSAAFSGRNLNPGLEDQRKAVEWVYQNIHAFGGDASRMVLFGQSAGAVAVDKYAYAWATDPLVYGMIAQSGLGNSVIGPTSDPTGSNFTYVANQLGCHSSSADQVLECMQNQTATDIINIFNRYNASANAGRVLSFTPKPDNYTSFANYTDLQARGRFAHIPAIISSTNNEASTLVTYNASDADGPNQAAVDAFTCGLATVPGLQAVTARNEYGLPVWRVRYFGEWPNLNPLPWLGAYHSSDMPMIFGTHDLNGTSTEAEMEASTYHQAAWVAFAKDPENGLTEYGWPVYNASSGAGLVQLGLNGSVEAIVGNGQSFDEACEA